MRVLHLSSASREAWSSYTRDTGTQAEVSALWTCPQSHSHLRHTGASEAAGTAMYGYILHGMHTPWP